jgi:hypothetical protein
MLRKNLTTSISECHSRLYIDNHPNNLHCVLYICLTLCRHDIFEWRSTALSCARRTVFCLDYPTNARWHSGQLCYPLDVKGSESCNLVMCLIISNDAHLIFYECATFVLSIINSTAMAYRNETEPIDLSLQFLDGDIHARLLCSRYNGAQ